MLDGISVIATELKSVESVRATLSGSGLAVWDVVSVGRVALDPRSRNSLFLIVDMPGLAGFECLAALRQQGVDIPAILIADSEFALSEKQIASVNILDVLKRPVERRALLAWIECICTAHVAMDCHGSFRQLPGGMATPLPVFASPLTTSTLSELPTLAVQPR